MSFFSETKNVGMAFMILGLISVIFGIISIALGAIEYKIDVGDEEIKFTIAAAIAAIGTVIGGCLYFGYGKKVRGNEVTAKIDILANYVRLVGVVAIITGVFAAAGEIAAGNDIGGALLGAIISIVVGLIIIWVASKINDGKQTTGDKIIWVILLILFVLGIIGAVLEMITIVGLPLGICDFIIYVFMTLLLLDGEVKSEMGI